MVLFGYAVACIQLTVYSMFRESDEQTDVTDCDGGCQAGLGVITARHTLHYASQQINTSKSCAVYLQQLRSVLYLGARKGSETSTTQGLPHRSADERVEVTLSICLSIHASIQRTSPPYLLN